MSSTPNRSTPPIGSGSQPRDWATKEKPVCRRPCEAVEIMPDRYEAAVWLLSSEDVLRFQGRKLHPSFQGEVVTSDEHRRPEGWRVEHRVRRDSIEMYDPYSVLRIETTLDNPGDVEVLEVSDTRHGRAPRRVRMAKGAANLWRYARRIFASGASFNPVTMPATATRAPEALRG